MTQLTGAEPISSGNLATAMGASTTSALTGGEPVSTGNLKAVLEKLPKIETVEYDVVLSYEYEDSSHNSHVRYIDGNLSFVDQKMSKNVPVAISALKDSLVYASCSASSGHMSASPEPQWSNLSGRDLVFRA